LVKRLEIEGTTYGGVLSSNYGDIPKYVETSVQGEVQGTIEAPLYASYLNVLPVNTRGGRNEQNLLIINFYFAQQLHDSNSRDYRLENFVAYKIAEVAEVEYIIVSKEENIFEIWIVINEMDRMVRERIYDIEYDIIEHFRDIYFDFHIVFRNNRDINELFSANAIIIYQK